MRIGINVSVLKAGENVSGIGYYTYRIVKELLDTIQKMNTTYLATARFPCIFRRTVECIIYCTPAKIVCFGQGIF